MANHPSYCLLVCTGQELGTLKAMAKVNTPRDEIESALRGDTFRHLYELGDLDDFFWPRTEWLGGTAGPPALLYRASDLTVLLALSSPSNSQEQLRLNAARIPQRCYAHLHPELASNLDEFELEAPEPHLKMALTGSLPSEESGPSVEWLGPADQTEISDFYARAYPGNWFDPEVLKSTPFAALRQNGELVAVAGVHVYSPRYRVAALGNVATLPAARGRGMASRVTTALCHRLLRTVDHIGLNVHRGNEAAVACYQKLGFSIHCSYEEGWLAKKRPAG